METLKLQENEIEFLINCCTYNQFFIALRKQASNVHTSADKVQQMFSSSQEVDKSLDKSKTVNMDYFGSLLENVRPCQVQ